MKTAANGDKTHFKGAFRGKYYVGQKWKFNILESFHQSTSCTLCSFDVHIDEMLNVLYPPF